MCKFFSEILKKRKGSLPSKEELLIEAMTCERDAIREEAIKKARAKGDIQGLHSRVLTRFSDAS